MFSGRKCPSSSSSSSPPLNLITKNSLNAQPTSHSNVSFSSPSSLDPLMLNPNNKANAPAFLLNDISHAELKRVFDQFDANGDGKISADELHHVLSALSSSSSTSAEDVRRAMEEIDIDKDGFIDLAEFSALCRGSPSGASAESELRDAFNLYDRDANGLISSRELHSVMNRLNMKCTVEDCERMIRSVDSDGDGFVNFDEFRKMMSISDSAATAVPNNQ